MTHQVMYAHPRLYELAFSHRQISSECRFLLDVATPLLGRPAEKILELAAGPAVHARAFATEHGLEAHALDLSQAMLDYAGAETLALGATLHCHLGDMASFRLPSPVDLACCLLDSIAYLTDHRAFRAHLDCVAEALCEGGIYVIEMDHPRAALAASQTTLNTWEVQDGKNLLKVQFGAETDTFDPVTQVRHTTFCMTLKDEHGMEEKWRECSPMKLYLYQEVLALIHASPFEFVQAFGALTKDVPLQGSASAWRAVLVLQKPWG